MTTKPIKWTYLKYLFWFGPILTIMGLTAQEVAGEWSPVSLALLIAGLLIIGLWFLLLDQIAPGFWGRRSTQVGTNAIIATLAMFVIIGLINFLGVRYGVQIDLTENQLFTLSPQSQQVVRNLDQSVKVWVFESPANPADQELLENYRRYGSNLEFEFVDPQLQPELAQKFNVNYIGEVYLEYGNQRELVQTISQGEQGERLSEVQLTNAIERITGDRTDKVYFLQGHGERPLEASDEGGLSQAVSALEAKNFTVEPLNLAEQPAVPDDASLIVIAGPKRALFEPEVQALEDYLADGGSLLVMIDPDTNPGLEPLLSDWGVMLTNQIVIDASGQGLVGLGPATPLVTQYGDHPITQDFGTGFSIYPLAQPVDTQPVEGIKETPLVVTSPQTWAENTPEQQPLEFNEQEGDRPGPLVLGVALSRQDSSASPPSEPEAEETPEAEGEDTDEPEAEDTPEAEGEDTDEPEAEDTPEAEGEDTDEPEAEDTPEVSLEDTDEPEAEETPEAFLEDTDEPEAETPEASPTASPEESPEASPSPIQTDESESQEDEAESRLIVYGNSNFATDSWFDQQLNPDIFINSVSWLSKRDEQALSISPKEPEDRRINLTPVQSGILGWLALLIVPAFGFLTAGMLWWLRR